VSRITGIRRDVSTAMGFVIPGVRIRDDMALPANAYRIRIRQAVVAEDMAYPDRKLALPGGGTTRKLRGIEVKDPSFGMDAVWIQPHQQPDAAAIADGKADILAAPQEDLVCPGTADHGDRKGQRGPGEAGGPRLPAVSLVPPDDLSLAHGAYPLSIPDKAHGLASPGTAKCHNDGRSHLEGVGAVAGNE